ncbi:MAG: flagellar basal body rod protein FlgC [Fimbriimonadaceae bacterium]
MSSIFSAMRSAASGMFAERIRMDVTSANIANAQSVKIGDQDPYRRRVVVLEGDEEGVRVQAVQEDQSELRAVSEPGNPLADAQGFVYYSNVDPLMEMVNMISATRAYEANVAAFNSAKGMARAALNIGKV